MINNNGKIAYAKPLVKSKQNKIRLIFVHTVLRDIFFLQNKCIYCSANESNSYKKIHKIHERNEDAQNVQRLIKSIFVPRSSEKNDFLRFLYLFFSLIKRLVILFQLDKDNS